MSTRDEHRVGTILEGYREDGTLAGRSFILDPERGDQPRFRLPPGTVNVCVRPWTEEAAGG